MAKTPVIFVPGICGSFNLPVLLDWRGPTLGGWDFPPFVSYGKMFVDGFQRAGYVRDKDLFVAFYDWRKAVKDSAITYLKPWIDRAKQRSGKAKVVLICHSMGGLVARSYIQSQSYAGDVERLITVGTPHRGSAEAYYGWGSGELRADPGVQAVFNVYLWYLRHAHPFQTELSPLRTMRTQVPAIRDLLPMTDYLLSQGAPPAPKAAGSMAERNLWGEILNLPSGVETLLRNVPVTTIGGVGFTTIRQIVVGGPPVPLGNPARYPDGTPISDQVDGDGDGTVGKASAQVDHPQAKNLPAVNVSHGNLADHPAVLTMLFGELAVGAPVLAAAPVQEPQLVIMTASPVRLLVQTPAGPPMASPGVLGSVAEDSAPRRSRRVRARDYGHSGKHLNIVVVPNPAAGAYKVQLDGTATGGFALGALLVSASGVQQVLGSAPDGSDGAGETAATATPIATVSGQVARESELHYEVICESTDAPPDIRLDVAATAQSTLRKLREGVRAAQGGVLGGADADPLSAVLGGAPGDDTLRDTAQAALADDDAALSQIAQMLGSASDHAAISALLASVAGQVVGGQDETLAAAILAQLAALR